jgi:hypothetical protein
MSTGSDLEMARQIRIEALSSVFDDPLADEMARLDSAIAAAVRAERERVARRCAAIAEAEMNTSSNPAAATAESIAADIRREFGIEEER